MSLTPAQQKAVVARGNVLVVAGAGAGKTSTLVARCLHCLLEENPAAALDEILMVTFTDAAASDMRRRIRDEFKTRAAQPSEPSPASLLTDKQRQSWLAEQLALFDTAHIGTLHSFCLQLVRQHFYELELDPQLTVLAEEEAKLQADETLESILQIHYAGASKSSTAVQQLIHTQARGWDQPIRALVLKLHHYTQTLHDPAGWFDTQLARFASPEPEQWHEWLLEGLADWRNRWLPALRAQPPANIKAADCAALLEKLPVQPSRVEYADVLEQLRLADQDWPYGKKTAWREPIEDFFDDAAFLRSVTAVGTNGDPLAEDWNWVRAQMATLLELTREFTGAFSRVKRELGVVDFHDLEQHALRLLVNPATQQPTAIACQWKNKLRFVFVDEYQDINEAQDAILKALSREGADANRFLVGDVKQSIYRFRLADPHIFQGYIESWKGGENQVIPLVDNFRSREAILKFVNAFFGAVMRREIGSVVYDEQARLQFGAPVERAALSLACDPTPRTELHLRLKGNTDSKGPAEEDEETSRGWAELTNLEEAEKEARLVALRLRELKREAHLIWDDATRAMRPVNWSDMAVLLRSPSGKAESYAKEFTRLGVPLLVARGGFYESVEVTDLLSLLQLLDNPLQDLPALAVLHSPLVGLSLDELATVRLALPRGHFWLALQQFHRTEKKHSGWSKVDRFLNRYAAWRKLARQVSLSRCLESVLNETHYTAWLLTQIRGEQRHANVQRLLALAQQFDRFQRQGLFRFLRFIEAQQAAETEPEVAAVSGENSVSLMSIHQSKGLEFPVVVVPDLGKAFNLSDLRAEIILDEKYGLCPQIKPPHTGQRYPSLPYWLARQRQKQETLGEELRLLYVAMTRARDTLILTGTIPAKKFAKQWTEPADLNTATMLTARNYLDWLGAWFSNLEVFPQTSAPDLDALAKASGSNELLRWTFYEDDASLLQNPSDSEARPEDHATPLDTRAWQRLQERLEWRYPHDDATREPAKTSVTAVRRRLADEAEEAVPRFKGPSARFKVRQPGSREKLSAAEIGVAHHTFLQLVALEKTDDVAALRENARRLELAGALTPSEVSGLDFPALAQFWQSGLGKNIRAEAQYVRRELPFTARFASHELKSLEPGDPDLFNQEFVIVQGVADLVVLRPDEIWLLDFKTDELAEDELDARVKLYEPQLQLYAMALNRIYRRPVSQLHLHFLALQRSVSLSPIGVQSG